MVTSRVGSADPGALPPPIVDSPSMTAAAIPSHSFRRSTMASARLPASSAVIRIIATACLPFIASFPVTKKSFQQSFQGASQAHLSEEGQKYDQHGQPTARRKDPVMVQNMVLL